MHVLFAASECTPFAKVGGLGDVIGALPKALSSLGVSIDIILPWYEHLLPDKNQWGIVRHVETFQIKFLDKNEECELGYLTFPHSTIKLYLIRNDTYLSNGGVYLSPSAMSQGDQEPERFMFFCKAVYSLLSRGILQYDIVHSHDYHTSLLLSLIYGDESLHHIKTVLSIHNLANKGKVKDPRLNKEIDGKAQEHEILRVGLESADRIIPVSQQYAREILTQEYGEGLDGVLREAEAKIVGITNGIDVEEFDPYTDTHMTVHYDNKTWQGGKNKAKESLFEQIGWNERADSVFLWGYVGRVADQKNIELLCEVLSKISLGEMRVVILGVGDPALENLLFNLAKEREGHVYYAAKFDESLARYIFAGSDGLLIPSKFEPCGLTQMIAMRYGTLPLARKTGGLAETIDDGKNGFLFECSEEEDLRGGIDRVFNLWKHNREEWNGMVGEAFATDFSWKRSARKYVKVYEELLAGS